MIKNGLKLIGLAVALLWLSSCSKMGSDDRVSLNVTGVDYAGTGIDVYEVDDPNDPKNKGGGFSITPYSADGVQCCFTVPREWHPGLKVNVLIRYPLEGETTDDRIKTLERREKNGTLVDTIPAEIPEYKTPARGTLWVQFMPNKKVKLVVSDLDPSHKGFPGEVKGWPVPSDEYKRKIIDARMQESVERLARSKKLLKAVLAGDKEELKYNWESYKRISPKKMDKFHGYDDPDFKKFFIKSLHWRIRTDEKTIENLKRARP